MPRHPGQQPSIRPYQTHGGRIMCTRRRSRACSVVMEGAAGAHTCRLPSSHMPEAELRLPERRARLVSDAVLGAGVWTRAARTVGYADSAVQSFVRD